MGKKGVPSFDVKRMRTEDRKILIFKNISLHTLSFWRRIALF